MMAQYTIDEFIKAHTPRVRTLDEFLLDIPKLQSLGDYQARMQFAERKESEEEKKNLLVAVAGLVDQLGIGALSSASYGFLDARDRYRPETTMEGIAQQAGHFGGMVIGPAAPAKVAGRVAKGLVGAAKAPIAFSKAGRVAGYVGERVGGLALTGLAQDIPEADADVARDWAKMGGVFAAAGVMHIPSHPVLSQILRQGAGRAMMKLTGMYPEGYLDKANAANVVWQEALNTYFLRHGVTPHSILTGRFDTPRQNRIVKAVEQARQEVVAKLKKEEPINIPKEHFATQPDREIKFDDIDFDPTRVEPQRAEMFRASIRAGKPMAKLFLRWDIEKGKYVPGSDDQATQHSLLQAFFDVYQQRRAAGESVPRTVSAKVAATPGEGVKLKDPIQVALDITKEASVTPEVVRLMDYSNWFIQDGHPKGKGKIVAAYDNRSKGTITGLNPYDVLWEFADGQLRIVAVGKKLKGKLVMDNEFIPDLATRTRIKAAADEVDAIKRYVQDSKQIGRDVKEQEAVLAEKEAALNKLKLETVKPRVEMADTETYEVEGKGTVKMSKLADKMMTTFEKIRSVPNMELPESYSEAMNKRIMELDMGIDNANIVYKAIGIPDGKPSLKHLLEIENTISILEATPKHMRIPALFEGFVRKSGLDTAPLEGELKERQDAAELWDRERVEKARRKAKKEWQADPTQGGYLSKLLSLSRWANWQDVRYTMMDWEAKTGLPFHRLYRLIIEGNAAKRTEVAKYSNDLAKFAGATEVDQIAVKEYFYRMYMGVDPSPTPLTEYQQEFVDTINRISESVRMDVFRERFTAWVKNVKEPSLRMEQERERVLEEDKGKIDEKIKALPKVYRRQNEEALREELNTGYHLYKHMKELATPDSIEAFQRWALHVDGKFGLGLIHEGAYLPQTMFNPKGIKMSNQEILTRIGTLGRGHVTKSRGKIQTPFQEIDLDDNILRTQLLEKNLAQQYENYLGQVMNLKYLEEPIEALDTLVEALDPIMSKAKSTPLFRRRAEVKKYSAEDFLKLWMMRIKGYPIKLGMIGGSLKGVQTIFFRSLTVRPMLIIRNLPQRFVTVPHKKMVLDHRFFGRKYGFDKLPEDIKSEFMSRGVENLDMIRQHYLDLEADLKVTSVPIIRQIWRAAGTVGRLYALSDYYNRRFVFSKTFWRSMHYLNEHQNGKIDVAKLEHELGVNKMRPQEQAEFRRALQSGDSQEAAFNIARWNTENSQWHYGRHERSLQEMTAEGEVFTNLLTWSKSMGQQIINTTKRLRDGFERQRRLSGSAKKQAQRQMFDAGAQMVGLFIAGGVANEVLNLISMNHKGRYQAYGADMFTWELGGVTAEVLREFFETMTGIVSAYDGTPDERKTAFEKVFKMADRTAIRQLFPFAKSALAIVEGFTDRAYISPLNEFFSRFQYGYPRGITKVDRTFLEGIIHAVMATDPNKSDDVRRWAFNRTRELQLDYAGEDRPLVKQAKYLYLKRMEYFNDLFQRYEPYEVAERMREREKLQRYERWKNAMDDTAYQRERTYYKARRR